MVVGWLGAEGVAVGVAVAAGVFEDDAGLLPQPMKSSKTALPKTNKNAAEIYHFMTTSPDVLTSGGQFGTFFHH
jgi:hypothetical protein